MGVAPPEITMGDVVRAALPYVLARADFVGERNQLSKPFCRESTRSHDLNKSVISPEQARGQ
jgi:hypothetical protein